MDRGSSLRRVGDPKTTEDLENSSKDSKFLFRRMADSDPRKVPQVESILIVVRHVIDPGAHFRWAASAISAETNAEEFERL